MARGGEGLALAVGALGLFALGGLMMSSSGGGSPASRPSPPRPSGGVVIPPGSEREWSQETKLQFTDPRLQLPRLLEELRGMGWEPRLAFTWRSPETQRELVAMGRSKVRFSFHNVLGEDGTPAAMAADVYDRRYGWGTDPKTKRQDPVREQHAASFFLALGAAAKRLGLHWGGDYRRHTSDGRPTSPWTAYGMGWDPAHVQLLPDAQLAAIREEHARRGLV